MVAAGPAKPADGPAAGRSGAGRWSPSITASGTGTAAERRRHDSARGGGLPGLRPMRQRLVEDLHQRGLDKDCTVVVWGEFGRTPKISSNVGRDHWPQVNCALLAGGGMKTGQVIGATDRIAGEAVSRPVTWGELFATLYRNLGIDPGARDAAGPHRPAAIPRRRPRQAAAGIGVISQGRPAGGPGGCVRSSPCRSRRPWGALSAGSSGRSGLKTAQPLPSPRDRPA